MRKLFTVIGLLSFTTFALAATKPALLDFTQITIKGNLQVDIHVGKKPAQVYLAQNKNAKSKVNYHVDQGTLYLTPKPHTGQDHIININTPLLSGITSTGNSFILATDINSTAFDLVQIGDGHSVLHGKVQNLSLVNSGNGNIDAAQLMATSVEAVNHGNGQIGTYPIDSLKAVITGNGDISYAHKPLQLQTVIIGQGQVTPHGPQ